MIRLDEALINKGNSIDVIDDIINEINYRINDGETKEEVLIDFGLEPENICMLDDEKL